MTRRRSNVSYLVSLARYDEADECAREALDLAREHQMDVLTAWTLQHFAAIGALRPQVDAEHTGKAQAQAARILGFVDARVVALRSARHVALKPEYDRILAVLCDSLGADAVATLMAAGALMTEEKAWRKPCQYKIDTGRSVGSARFEMSYSGPGRTCPLLKRPTL